MVEGRDRLQALELIQAPDLTDEIRGRVPRSPRIEPRRGRSAAILLSLAVASAGTFLAVRAFRSTEGPRQPATTNQDGMIAFSAFSGGHWQIFSTRADGSDRSQLTALSTDQFHPAWSPDGSRIAFSAQSADGEMEIHVMDADGSNVEQLTEGPGYLPAWSPDGSRIVFVSNRDGNDEIYVMDADGSNQTRLTDDPDEELAPVWSPDGTRIAFQSNRGGGNEIFVMNAQGKNVRNLTDVPGSGEFDPAWSPDGMRIAFASDRDGNPEIYVMNADGSGVARLTNDPAHDWNPAWAPDGSKIAFESDRDGAVAVYIVDLDGKNPVRLTDAGVDACCPTWQQVISDDAPSPTA
jgi:Tol biopolymer transport system component